MGQFPVMHKSSSFFEGAPGFHRRLEDLTSGQVSAFSHGYPYTTRLFCDDGNISAGRKVLHVSLTVFDPVRVNQAFPLGIELLVGTTDSAIANVCHLRDLLCCLALAHKI